MAQGIRIGVVAAVVLALGAPRARAERPLRELSIEDLLDVEVVTPTVKVQAAREAPASIYVVSEETIRNRGYRSLLDLLEDLPGITIDRNSAVEWGDHINARGLVGGERFVILLDGMVVNSATGNPHSLREAYSLTNIARVEVVMGPGSALYGADAFAGVIHMISKGGAAIQGAQATGSYGRFDTSDQSFVLGGATRNVAGAVWGNIYHSDEPNLPSFYPDDYAWYHERYLTRGEVRVSPFAPPDAVQTVAIEPYRTPRSAYSLHARLDLGDLRLSFARLHEAHSTSTGARPEFSVATLDARWAYTIDVLGARHVFTLDEAPITVTSVASLQTYELDPSSAYVNAFDAYQKQYKYSADLVVEIEERATWEPSERWSLSLGGSVTDASALPKTFDLVHPYDPDVGSASQGFYYPNTDVVDVNGRHLRLPLDLNEVRYRNLGAYGEIVASPHDAITVTTGVRVDHDSRFGATVNPRAGIVVAPAEATRVKLLYGEAFMAPSPLLQYQHYGAFTPDRGPADEIVGLRSDFLFLPNPDLGPEKLRTGELSLSQTAGPVSLGASGFYTAVSGLIVQEEGGPTTFKGWPVASYGHFVNRGTASIHGGTLLVDAVLPTGPVMLRPSASYAYTGGDVDGSAIPTPPHTVKLAVDASWSKFSLSLRMLGRDRTPSPSERDADGDPLTSPGSLVTNLFARVGDLDFGDEGRASIWCSIENLFDQRYYHHSDGAETFFGTPQDPFRILVGITVDKN